MLRQLSRTAIDIEKLYDGVPQDIEWAVVDEDLYLLQRPTPRLGTHTTRATCRTTHRGGRGNPRPRRQDPRYRRQIVENMPDPICPLFEELYLTEGLESSRKGKVSMMPGGGPSFVTCNGYAYNRADHPSNHIDPNSSEEELKAVFKRHDRRNLGTSGGSVRQGTTRHGSCFVPSCRQRNRPSSMPSPRPMKATTWPAI